MIGRSPLVPSSLRAAPLTVALALGAVGCYGGGDGTYTYPSSAGPVACKDGVESASIDTGALLALDPGNGVGATVEYTGDGNWRFAVTCDSLITNYPCYWVMIVSSIDGSIESLAPDELELDDVVEFYPSVAGSTVEDGVRLDSTTNVDIDAFTVLATPGAGMHVDARIGVDCGGPYLFWTDQAAVRHSSTNATDLVPSE